MQSDKDWPHAPVHRIGSDGVYMITGATLYSQHLFSTPEKLTLLENELLTLAKLYSWQLEAWSVFRNHYHMIARGNPDAARLDRFVKHLHANTARDVNALDRIKTRQVWYNFWETRLTYERSYLARLNYVHQKRGEARSGASCESVSMVFRCVVRENSLASYSQNDL